MSGALQSCWHLDLVTDPFVLRWNDHNNLNPPQKTPRQDLDEEMDLQLALLPAFHRGHPDDPLCWLLAGTTESWDSIFGTRRSTLGADMRDRG